MSSETTTQSPNWNLNEQPTVVEALRVKVPISEEMLYKLMEELLVKELKERIKELEKNEDEVNIPDSAAEAVIRDQLKRLKRKNVREIDAIDVHSMTKLPVQQIGKIMSKLEEEGVIREDGRKG